MISSIFHDYGLAGESRAHVKHREAMADSAAGRQESRGDRARYDLAHLYGVGWRMERLGFVVKR